MRVELGNNRLHERRNGVLTPVERVGSAPSVSYLNIPDGEDGAGNPLYSFPDDHGDHLWPDDIATALGAVPDGPAKQTVRRTIIDGWLSHSSGVRGLPNHAALVAVIHPGGFWNEVSALDDDPSWVWSDNEAFMNALADYYGCPAGRPDRVEDTHWTSHGATTYPPGAMPTLNDIQALHTSIGRDIQALQQGGFATAYWVGGQASAATATTLTSAATTSHALNDVAGQWLVVGPNASGTGSQVYGLINSNTTGTTPVFTVDQWYAPATPGGAVGTTPNATSFYEIIPGAPPALFVALTTDTTTPALAGSAGTADAATITQALTSEINVGSGGLNRKIAPIGHSAGAATWTATPVFTANGSDVLPKVVAKAALCISNVGAGGGLTYMTLVSPTATISASGDQLTLTWTFTMT